MIPQHIIDEARKEIAIEDLRVAIDTEKARIRVRRTRWTRLTAWIPFTITFKWRNQNGN